MTNVIALKVKGDKVYSGTVVKRGEQDFVVTETGENAEIGKGVALIQSVESKGQVYSFSIQS